MSGLFDTSINYDDKYHYETIKLIEETKFDELNSNAERGEIIRFKNDKKMLEALRAKLEKCSDEETQLLDMEKQLDEVRKTLTGQINESDSDFDKDVLNKKLEEILTLKTELETQNKSIDEMTADLTQKIKEIETKNNELSEQKNKVLEEAAKLEEAKLENVNLTEQLKQNREGQLKQNADEAAAAITRAEKATAEAEKLKAANAAIDELSKKLQHFEGQLKQNEDEAAASREQAEKATTEANAAIDELTKQIEEKDATEAAADVEKINLVEKIKELQGQLKKYENEAEARIRAEKATAEEARIKEDATKEEEEEEAANKKAIDDAIVKSSKELENFTRTMDHYYPLHIKNAKENVGNNPNMKIINDEEGYYRSIIEFITDDNDKNIINISKFNIDGKSLLVGRETFEKTTQKYFEDYKKELEKYIKEEEDRMKQVEKDRREKAEADRLEHERIEKENKERITTDDKGVIKWEKPDVEWETRLSLLSNTGIVQKEKTRIITSIPATQRKIKKGKIKKQTNKSGSDTDTDTEKEGVIQTNQLAGATTIEIWRDDSKVFPVGIKIDDVSIGKKFNYTNIQEPFGSVQMADTTRKPIKTFPTSSGDKNSRQVDIYRVVEIKGNYNTAKLYKVIGDDKINLPSVAAGAAVWTDFYNKYAPEENTELIMKNDKNNTDIEIYYFVSILTMNNGNIDNLLYNNLTTHTLPDERTISYNSVYSSKPILTSEKEKEKRKRNNKLTDGDLINRFGKVINAVAPIGIGRLTSHIEDDTSNNHVIKGAVGRDRDPFGLMKTQKPGNGGGMDGGGKPRLSITSLRYLSKY